MEKGMEVVTIEGYVNIPTNNKTAIMSALVEYGPLGIVVDANHYGAYWGGIFNHCYYKRNVDLNHLVVLVGYGTEGGNDFWIVRNSWGHTFGEGGYLRVIRETET